MLYHTLLILSSVVLSSCDVSHLQLQEDHTTEPPPPKPYVFSYTAGRYPGHADRQHTEVSDGSGVIRGSFSYVDPRQKVRTVDYIADKEGFHPILNDAPPEHPADSESVAQAKDKHYRLYAKIAEEHAHQPHPLGDSTPRQSAAVALASAKHAQLFKVIAEQHARIAAEREALQREEEEKQNLQELGH
ncbi:cuticle protein 16.8-like [Achroia grisella]|uniref:cuticle protein 16.8-like n=1 Tax=Achroia grisella TaxID=688607 RepID=UPI0027D20F65|nr:cuticle protein 16.8-like [Achroia grisella]XP_059047283.1 cuticle protein 16.8-like [Achroia grisella]